MDEHDLPWKIKQPRLRSDFNVVKNDGWCVAVDLNKEDAEYIVEACNNYQTLKQENEQLKEALFNLWVSCPESPWDEESEYGKKYNKTNKATADLLKELNII